MLEANEESEEENVYLTYQGRQVSYLSIYLSICLFIYLSILNEESEEDNVYLTYQGRQVSFLPIYLSIYLFIYLSIYSQRGVGGRKRLPRLPG